MFASGRAAVQMHPNRPRRLLAPAPTVMLLLLPLLLFAAQAQPAAARSTGGPSLSLSPPTRSESMFPQALQPLSASRSLRLERVAVDSAGGSDSAPAPPLRLHQRMRQVHQAAAAEDRQTAHKSSQANQKKQIKSTKIDKAMAKTKTKAKAKGKAKGKAKKVRSTSPNVREKQAAGAKQTKVRREQKAECYRKGSKKRAVFKDKQWSKLKKKYDGESELNAAKKLASQNERDALRAEARKMREAGLAMAMPEAAVAQDLLRTTTNPLLRGLADALMNAPGAVQSESGQRMLKELEREALIEEAKSFTQA